MKKSFAVCLAAMLCLLCLSGLVTAGAEGGESVPILLLDGPNLNVPGGLDCAGTYDYEKEYITLEAIGGDPYYYLYSGNPLYVGSYLSFKYRTEDPIEQGQIWAIEANGGVNVNCSFMVDYEADGQWHVMTICLTDVLPATFEEGGQTITGFDPATKLLGCLRFDFNDQAQVGETMDIEYVAFFETLEDAENYEHQAPATDEGPGEDGSNKTYSFDSVMAAKSLFVMEHRWVDVRIEEGGPGYVTFVAGGADPYLQFQDPVFPVTGRQASYMVVLYRTEADSQATTKIEFYTNIVEGAQWGATTHAEAELVPDGQWHYALVDATETIGQYDGNLEAFRIDPLAVAEEGETIDIETIKMFGDRETVWAFFEALAEEGDELAQEFLDTHSFVEQPEIPEESSSVEDETDPVEDNTEPVTEESSSEEDVTEETVDTGAATDAVDATEGEENTSENADEVPEPATSGCKGVIASAAVLSIVTLAAGAVIFKKKD